MDAASVAVLLKIIEIALAHGVPHLIAVMSQLGNNDHPTIAQIEALSAKVQPLTEDDFR